MGDHQPATEDTTLATRGKPRARVTAGERRRRKESEAAQLRAQGLDYDAIAQQLGYRDRSGAHKAVTRALIGTARLPTEGARRLAMQRLDGLRCSLVNIATGPGVSTRDLLGSLRLLLDIEKREAALLGLDLPAEPATPLTPDVLDAEIARLTRELHAFDALRPPDPWDTPWTPQDALHDAEPRGSVVPSDRRGDRP